MIIGLKFRGTCCILAGVAFKRDLEYVRYVATVWKEDCQDGSKSVVHSIESLNQTRSNNQRGREMESVWVKFWRKRLKMTCMIRVNSEKMLG